MIVLLSPVRLLKPAVNPKKALEPPVVVLTPASTPKKALLSPDMLNKPASTPKKALREPVVFAFPASLPKKELKSPTPPLDIGVVEAPAPTPANVLLFTSVPAPLMVKTRFPPMLNCVTALTTLPVNVPPAVPFPEMLKFALWAELGFV